MAVEKMLIAGGWRESTATSTFHAENPATRAPLAGEFPVSGWQDCDEALTAAVGAAKACGPFLQKSWQTSWPVTPEN